MEAPFDITVFMGKPIEYWIELQNHADDMRASRLFDELAKLRAKVSFYESRLDEMAGFRAAVDKCKP